MYDVRLQPDLKSAADSAAGRPSLGPDEALLMAGPLFTPTPCTYLEGTDACGKDTVADLMGAREASALLVPPKKSGGFFLDGSRTRLRDWSEEHPDPELTSGLLLMATVRDLAIAGISKPSELPTYQASHNSIRGAAYEIAFGCDLSELFDETTSMVPPAYLPVALETSLQAIGERVLKNPHATPFDFLVFEQPGKISKMLEVIADRCRRLGGLVITTTGKTPDEVVEEIIGRREVRPGAAPMTDSETIIDRSIALLMALKQMKKYNPLAALIEVTAGEISVA
jgi:hypothetical protein